MTAPDPAWVEAGAKAIHADVCCPCDPPQGCEYPDDLRAEQMQAMLVITTVAPLIREQIAADIEARADQYGDPPAGPVRVLVAAYRDAARIARRNSNG